MAIICINVDDIFPGSDDSHISVSYRWFSTDGTSYANDSGGGEFAIGLSSLLNQSVVDACVAASGVAGVTIGILDRKVIRGFA